MKTKHFILIGFLVCAALSMVGYQFMSDDSSEAPFQVETEAKESSSCFPDATYTLGLRSWLASHYSIDVKRLGLTQANVTLEGHWELEFIIDDDIDGVRVDNAGFIIDDEITGFYGPGVYLTKELPCGTFQTQFIIDDEIEGF